MLGESMEDWIDCTIHLSLVYFAAPTVHIVLLEGPCD